MIPFKIGEFLRFFAFTKVCKSTRKGAAIWLIERLGDILIISLLILFLYVFNINIPQAMQAIFIIFAVTCMFTLFTIFSLSKVVIYLKRNLILTSLSSRSLLILKFSDRFRLFEIEMHKVIEGRIMGFILLSSLIWFFEITSLSIFLNQVETINSNFADIFSNSILGTLSQEEFSQFKIYQYLVLFGLTFTSILILYLRDKFKKDSR